MRNIKLVLIALFVSVIVSLQTGLSFASENNLETLNTSNFADPTVVLYFTRNCSGYGINGYLSDIYRGLLYQSFTYTYWPRECYLIIR